MRPGVEICRCVDRRSSGLPENGTAANHREFSEPAGRAGEPIGRLNVSRRIYAPKVWNRFGVPRYQ
jgi:hypothetical protein